MFILFAASVFCKLSSIYVFSYFPFGFEGRVWDLIVSVPDHCLSFYFPKKLAEPEISYGRGCNFFFIFYSLIKRPGSRG